MRLFIRPLFPITIAIACSVVSLCAQDKPEDKPPKDNGNNWLQKALDEREKAEQLHQSQNDLDTDRDLLKDTENKGEVKTDLVPNSGDQKTNSSSGNTTVNGVKMPGDNNKNQTSLLPGDKTTSPNGSALPGSSSDNKSQKPAGSGLEPLSPFSSFTTGGINSLNNGQPNLPAAQSNDPVKTGLNFGMDLPKANPLLALPDYESSKHLAPDNGSYKGYESYPNSSENNGAGSYGSYNIKPTRTPIDTSIPGSDAYMKNLLDQSNQPLQAPKPVSAGSLNPQSMQSLHSMDNPQPAPAIQPLTLGLQPPVHRAIIVSQPAAGQTRIMDPNDFLDR